MQQFNLGDYKGGRENIGQIMGYEMPQHAQTSAFASQLGQIAAQSVMGRQANTELLGMKLAAQSELQDRAAAAQKALYERQSGDEETKYQRRSAEEDTKYQRRSAEEEQKYQRRYAEGLDTYDRQFMERQAEFDRQQREIEAREGRDYERKKGDVEAINQEKRQAFEAEMQGAHKALVDYHRLVLSARRPEDPDYQMSAKFLEGLEGAQGQNPYYIQGLLNQHTKNGINPFALGQLGIASAKPAQPKTPAQNKGKVVKPIPKGFHLDDKYNQS